MKRAELRIFENKAVFSCPDKGRNLVISALVEKEASSGSHKKVFELLEKTHNSFVIAHDSAGSCRSFTFEHIFGFYDLLSGPYVALVTETEPFVDEKSIGSIRKVKRVRIVPLFKNMKLLSEPKQMDEMRYLQLLNQTFADNIFFLSLNYDLTLTQQRISLASFGKSDPMWRRACHRFAINGSEKKETSPSPFFWNHNVVMDLINIPADDWITPFMSGFIDFRPDITIDNNTKVSLLLISRRSRHRQGCRYTMRGLDTDGNPANFVETEQILIFQPTPVKEVTKASSSNATVAISSSSSSSAAVTVNPDLPAITSFVQIRGSIVLKWSSPVTMKYDPKVYIDDDSTLQVELALKHIQSVHDTYADNKNKSRIVFVNLVDMKNDQQRLGEAFAKTIEDVKTKIYNKGNEILKYVWFDFHNETKQKGKWDNLAKLVRLLDVDLKEQGFFSKNFGGIVTNYQRGIFRTNCMDNLDRTNVVQSLLARRSIFYQLGKESMLEDPQKGSALVLNTPWKQFETMYKTVWTNNADALSLSYAGTGALKTDFTKTGKRTYKGILNDGINAATRYYVNNFTDGAKQDGIDLLLGKYRPTMAVTSPFTERLDRDTLANFLVRIFVFFISVFSMLLLTYRIVSPISGILGKMDFMKSQDIYLQKTFADSISENIFVKKLIDLQGLALIKFWHSTNSQKLCTFLGAAYSITIIFSGYLSFIIMKVGSRLGERLVARPHLKPETLPRNFMEYQ